MNELVMMSSEFILFSYSFLHTIISYFDIFSIYRSMLSFYLSFLVSTTTTIRKGLLKTSKRPFAERLSIFFHLIVKS